MKLDHKTTAPGGHQRRWVWPIFAALSFAVGLLLPRPWGSGDRDRSQTGSDGPSATGPSVGNAGLLAAGPSGNPAGTGEAAPADEGALETDPALPRLRGYALQQLADEALRSASALKRSLAFSKLLEGLTPENAVEMLETLDEMGASGNQREMFRYAWAAVDGPAAVAYGASLEGRDRERFLEPALTGWASSDPDAAIAWLESIEDPKERADLTGDLVGGLADHDTDRAAEYVLGLAREGNRNAGRYMDSVVEEKLRGGDVVATATWAGRLPDGDLKGSALDRVANAYTNRDPEEAARWATQFASAEYGVRAVEEVADEWAERDPENAVNWLESLPVGKAKDEGLQSALNEWTERDPLAASQYLTEMPSSPTRDRAVNGFVWELAGSDPQSAVVWAETIGHEELRVEALTRAAREWFRRDAGAAAEWIASSNLPLDAQEAIVKPPQRRGRR